MINMPGTGEWIMILIIALIIFGPGKLPELGKGIGKAIREFKRGSQGITEEINRALVEKDTSNNNEKNTSNNNDDYYEFNDYTIAKLKIKITDEKKFDIINSLKDSRHLRNRLPDFLKSLNFNEEEINLIMES